MVRRAFLVGSKTITLRGKRNGSRPCAYNMKAAPMSCATCFERMPSNPSQTKPSINWCTAKRIGKDANINSRRCFTLLSVTTPTAPNAVLPTKFAAAEKHTVTHLRLDVYIHPQPPNVQHFLRSEICTVRRLCDEIFIPLDNSLIECGLRDLSVSDLLAASGRAP